MESNWPGTPEHQALLRAVAAFYADDPRVRAVCVFGSLVRGNWDAFSDLDLDVVVADEVVIPVAEELRRLCVAFAPLGESAALIIPNGTDSGDVVLHSGRQLSVRYHPLAATSPNIIDSLRCLAGPLDPAEIIAAGRAQAATRAPAEPLARLLDRSVRYAVEVDAALQRGRLWPALELLHRMRGLLMLVFGHSRGWPRPEAAFEAEASPALQASLAAGVPSFTLPAMRTALLALLELLENDLAELSAGQAVLSDGQDHLIRQVRGLAAREGEET
jgi:hypothetical protein